MADDEPNNKELAVLGIQAWDSSDVSFAHSPPRPETSFFPSLPVSNMKSYGISFISLSLTQQLLSDPLVLHAGLQQETRAGGVQSNGDACKSEEGECVGRSLCCCKSSKKERHQTKTQGARKEFEEKHN